MRYLLQVRLPHRRYATTISANSLHSIEWHFQHACRLSMRTYRILDTETGAVLARRKVA
jgi:hypothetical protein